MNSCASYCKNFTVSHLLLSLYHLNLDMMPSLSLVSSFAQWPLEHKRIHLGALAEMNNVDGEFLCVE